MNDGKEPAVILDLELNSKHSEICRNIFIEALGKEYPEPISIYIPTDENGKGAIRCLADALNTCMLLKPAVISMSIGTVCLSDGQKLYPIIQQLIHLGTHIVGALSNKRIITYPACFKEVIGVISDEGKKNHLNINRVEENDYNIDLVANYNELSLVSRNESGNSFAVPVVAGRLYRDILEYGKFEQKKWLKKFKIKDVPWLTEQKSKQYIQDKPVIRLMGTGINVPMIRLGFSYLKIQYDIEAVFHSCYMELTNLECFYQKNVITAADIIFGGENDFGNAEVDFIMKVEKNSICLIDTCEKKSFFCFTKLEEAMDQLVLLVTNNF